MSALTAKARKEVGRIEHRAVRHARKVVEAAIWKATLVNDHGTNDAGELPLGWTEQERRIAMDARKSERHAPIYLKIATRLTENADRIAAAHDTPRVQLNVAVIQIEPRQYPVVEIDASKENV